MKKRNKENGKKSSFEEREKLHSMTIKMAIKMAIVKSNSTSVYPIYFVAK